MEDPKDPEAQDTAVEAPSMFTRKGLMVLIILMALEGVLIWGGFEFTQKRVNPPDTDSNSGFDLQQFSVGEINVNLPARTSNDAKKILSFNLWFRCKYKKGSKGLEGMTKVLNDEVQRSLRDKIEDNILIKWWEDSKLSFTDKGAKKALKQEIAVLLNKSLYELLLLKEVKVSDTPVHSVLFEEWSP